MTKIGLRATQKVIASAPFQVEVSDDEVNTIVAKFQDQRQSTGAHLFHTRTVTEARHALIEWRRAPFGTSRDLTSPATRVLIGRLGGAGLPDERVYEAVAEEMLRRFPWYGKEAA